MEPQLRSESARWGRYFWDYDMQVPQQAISLIEKFEGLRFKPYKDGAGFGTVGFGHKIKEGESFTEITLAQADALLRADAILAMQGVQRMVSVPLNNNQMSALISFAYNVGLTHFAGSGLLTTLNEGNYSQVPSHLLQWNKAGGEVEMGLTRRRQAEVSLWSTPDVSNPN